MKGGRWTRVHREILPPCLVALLLVAAPPPPHPAGGSAASRVLPWGAAPAAGQSPSAAGPSLDRVDTLARAGRTEGAREELLRWYEAASVAAPREDLQQALWLRAVLTVDPAQAGLDLRRLVVEYPGGPWTPGALLRLGLLAEAGAQPDVAAEHYRALVRDHPDSEAAVQAAPRLEPAAPTTTGAADFTVQLGAFDSRERALTLMAQAREAGFDVRLVRVPGSDLIRVRAGRFADPEAAMPVYDRVVSRGFEAAVISGASREVPAG